ncbi:uncharacterized protein PpBr36_09790 [Pyricularia pennisetigena]|uniref:uncharacterized protein n=1 Tax=Pyricularia pennisetigena TaxID=1578925 RepID=UPI00114F679C|nr:uncharacterized protein PpBr36_09790 [Pyricularia pennisetigena]TLS22355.1 hypothetical protein PpBr36_09790 [Pyricularia pennisetigena]
MTLQPNADLLSKEHRALFDIIDKLRSHGIGQVVDLPEIIVCGDQSAGKSSVLEAISGHPFPTRDGLCTRFVTELVLRWDHVDKFKVFIKPGPERTVEDAVRLREFCDKLPPNVPLDQVIEAAKDAMGLGTSKRFSTDVLRVEISGPNQAHLTMVDLPGLFRAGSSQQSVEDVKIVGNMVRKAMSRPRSIILAVVSASNEFNNQEVTELARKMDPQRVRTLGLITKPDKLEEGSESERNYLNLVRNQDVVLELGWHVLRNQGHRVMNSENGVTSRDEVERDFFSQGAWRSIDASSLGVAALRKRLSAVLWKQILHHLPSLREEMEDRIRECEETLLKLGDSRETVPKQRRYLLGVSQRFCQLMTAAVEGNYSDAFFADADSDEGYAKRIRAVVQSSLRDFKDIMIRDGKTEVISDYEIPTEGHRRPANSNLVARSEYIKRVVRLMDRSKGRELPGTFNPIIVQDLFKEQCRPWKAIVADTTDLVVAAVTTTAMAILYHVALPKTVSGISAIIHEGIGSLKLEVEAKIEELLAPHYKGHPITYNHYLTDMVQKAQAQRRRKNLEKFVESNLTLKQLKTNSSQAFTFGGLVELLSKMETIEPDMEQQASGLAVALKRIIDEVSDLAVERQLICFLPSLFTPETVYDLSDEEVSALAAEDEQAAAERVRCSELLSALHASMVELKRLDGHRTAAYKGLDSTPASSSSDPPSPYVYSQSPTPEPREEDRSPPPVPVLASPQERDAEDEVPLDPPADPEPPEPEDDCWRLPTKKDKKKRKKSSIIAWPEPERSIEAAPFEFE